MNFTVAIEIDIRIQQKLIRNYEKALSKAPDGSLSFKRIDGKVHYYCVDEKTGAQKHLSRKKYGLILQLKMKKLIQTSIKRMRNNIKWQEKLLKHYQPYDAKTVEASLSMVYRDEALYEYEGQFVKSPEQWAKEYYKTNPFYPEHLNQMTSFGLVVRTKSEALIAELLHAAGIPFRYDSELMLKDRYGKMHTYYPDFVIMTPQGKLIYWEHYGLFDDERYRNRFFDKTDTYYCNGIVQPKNYIVTMDGPNGDVDLEGVHQIIEGIILPYFRVDDKDFCAESRFNGRS